MVSRYYENVFPEGKQRASKHFAKAGKLLVAMPQLGRPVDDTAVREHAIAGLPFSFIYRIMDDRIEVLRLWDQRGERPETWIDR
jgi:plasmid stabilization system protein ParE